MAGDWIKMRKSLTTCPKVAVVCRLTKLDTYAVCGRLLALWSWADEHTSDGHAPGIDADYIDTLVGRRGFGEALTHEHVGWVEVTDDGLRFPDYEKHNGATGKTRAQAQRRQAKKRDECHGPVTNRSRTKRDNSVTRGEERREEETHPTDVTPLPPDPGDPIEEVPESTGPGFLAFWAAYPARGRTRMSACIAAWNDATDIASNAAQIVSKASEYAKSPRGSGRYCLAAHRWLEGRCWEDAPEAWQDGDDDTQPAKPRRDYEALAKGGAA